MEYKEIFKLMKLLSAEGIDYKFYDDSKKDIVRGYQVLVPYFDSLKVVSVVQNKYSKGNEADCLEMWECGTKNDAVGFLKAEQCINLIKEIIKK